MNMKKGPMKAILTTMIAAVLVLLSACGSDADTAADSEVETAPVTETDKVPVTEAEPVTSTTVEPEPEPESDVDNEAHSALEEAVAGMAVAWGNADGDLAWSFDSERCRDGMTDAPDGFVDAVVGYGTTIGAGATASNIAAVVDGDRAAATYDVYDGAGAFVFTHTAQPWLLSDGDWFRDVC